MFVFIRVLQHRVKVVLTVILLAVFLLSYYLDGPHQTVSSCDQTSNENRVCFVLCSGPFEGMSSSLSLSIM